MIIKEFKEKECMFKDNQIFFGCLTLMLLVAYVAHTK